MPVSPAEQTGTHSVPAATSAAPLYALTHLDAQSLATQEMTDQELKAVEGGRYEVYVQMTNCAGYFEPGSAWSVFFYSAAMQ